MIDLAYIQREDHGEFLSEATYSFWHGCTYLGIPTASFTQHTIDTLPLTKSTMVYGGIGMVRKAFDRLGVPQPKLDGLPPAGTEALYGRRIWATTMAEVRQGYEDNRFFFIKPLKQHKAFTGHVTSGTLSSLAKTAHLEDSYEVMASEVVEFVAEYRLFVHRGKILGSRFYCGDFRQPVSYSVADEFITAFKDAPVAYSLDLGVDRRQMTRVVEINDAFSLGSYGMNSIAYTRMVMDRWEEIVGTL